MAITRWKELTSPQFWLAELTQVLEDAEKAIENYQDPESCLEDLYHVQAGFIIFPLDVREYVDGLFNLRAKIVELQDEEGQEHIDLPRMSATAYCPAFQYYQQLLNILDILLKDFVKEYSRCIPVNQSYKALLKYLELVENEQARALLEIIKKIPLVFDGEMSWEHWNEEYTAFMRGYVPNDADFNFVISYVSERISSCLSEDVGWAERQRSTTMAKDKLLGFAVAQPNLPYTLMMSVLVAHQFTCAAAAPLNNHIALSVSEQSYLNSQSEIKHEVNEHINKEFHHSIMDQLTIYMGLSTLDVAEPNQTVDTPHLDPKDLKTYVKQKVAETSKKVTAKVTHTVQEDLQHLLKTVTPKNLVTRFNLINEAYPQFCPVRSLQELGFAENPRQVFDQYALCHTEKLRDVNYFFVPAAATKPFDRNLIDKELIVLLRNDTAKKGLQSQQMMEDLATYQDKVLFQITYDYASGNGILTRNSTLSLRWAAIAAQRGNLWAAVHISEYLFLGMDIVRSKDPHILKLLGVTEDMLEDGAHIDYIIRTTNLKYLRFAAAHGHSHASHKLGEIYARKTYGYEDSKLAQAYMLQSVAQYPYSLGILNELIFVTTNRLKKVIKKFPEFNWETFDAEFYQRIRDKFYHDMQVLKSATATLEKLLSERSSFEHMLIHAGPLVARTPKQIILEARETVRTTNRLMTKMTMELNGKHILWPSIEEFELFGVQCLKWSTSNTPDYIDSLLKSPINKKTLEALRYQASKGVTETSIRLGDCYAQGIEVPINKELALYFYRQAQRQDVKKEIQIIILSKINDLVAEKVKVYCQATIDHYLHFKNYPQHVSALLDNHEQTNQLGLQHFTYETVDDFVPEAMTNPRKVPQVLLDQLREDVEQASLEQQAALKHYIYAIEDGDYSDIPLIAYHYYRNKNIKQSLLWYELGADHGHLPSMYMVGYININGEAFERQLNKGVLILTRASAHGHAPASRLLAILTRQQPIERAYAFQARVQDPTDPLNAEGPAPEAIGHTAAMKAMGLTKFKRAIPALGWYPVERDEALVETMWQDLRDHSTSPQQVDKLYKAYHKYDNTVFLRVANWYLKQGRQKKSDTMKYYAYLWGVLGFRCGDIDSAHFIGELSFELVQISDGFPIKILAVLINAYKMPGIVHVRNDMDTDKAVKVSDYVQSLGLDALCYAAYHGHAHASELLSYVSDKRENKETDLEYLGRSRVFLAQALMQGSRLPYTVYNYLVTSIKWLESYRSVLWHEKSNTHYKYHTEAVIIKRICKIQTLMIDHFESMLTLQYLQGVYTTDHKKHQDFLAKIVYFRKMTAEFSNLINFDKAKKHGVRIPLLERPVHVAHQIMRPRQEWEWHDCIPELIDPYRSAEMQPRMDTLIALQNVQHPLINKLKKHWITNPAEMLELWELCLQHQKEDLARRWLDHAANIGDRVANRIVALRTNNKAKLITLALHGDAEASHNLAKTETDTHHSKLLHNQAVKWYAVESKRKEYRDVQSVKEETQESSMWVYYLSSLGAAAMGLGGAGINWVMKKRALKQQQAELARVQIVENIARQLKALSKLPLVKVEHNAENDVFSLKLLETNEVTYQKAHKFQEKIVENDFELLAKLVKECLEIMMLLGLRKVSHLDQKKLNELLKEFSLVIKHHFLSCRLKGNDVECLMTLDQRVLLVQKFVQLCGFKDSTLDGNVITVKCVSKFEMSPLLDYLCDMLLFQVFTEYHLLNERQLELIKAQADKKDKLRQVCLLIQEINKEAESKAVTILRDDIITRIAKNIPDNINNLGNAIIAACDDLIKLLSRADDLVLKSQTLEKLEDKKYRQRETMLLKYAEQVNDARKVICRQAEYYSSHQDYLYAAKKAEAELFEGAMVILQIANNADHYVDLQGLIDEMNQKILFVNHHPVVSNCAPKVVDAAKEVLTICSELERLLPQVPLYMQDLHRLNELNEISRVKTLQAAVEFTNTVKNLLIVLQKDSAPQRRMHRAHHKFLEDIHQISLKHRIENAKEEAAVVKESPRSQNTSSRNSRAEEAEKPRSRAASEVDVSLVDFSLMKCIHPSSPAKLFEAKPTQRKKSDLGRWLQMEISERLRVLNTLLTHEDFQLEEKIKMAEGRAKDRFEFLLAMRNNALHYRFLRLQLMLFLVNHQRHNIPVDQSLCNQDVYRFTEEFVNVLLHNYFNVEARQLIDCINNCYMDKDIEKHTELLVKKSAIYKSIWPPSNIKDIKIPRTGDLLIMDLKRTCVLIAQIRKVTSEKFEGFELWSAYQDSCRMLIMIIGEIDQRLHLLCPKISDHIHHERRDLIPILAFMRECHQLVRNMDKHREDIPAIYEAAITNKSFVVENYTVEDLFTLVDKAIHLSDHTYKFEHFCSYFVSVMERKEINTKNKM